MGTPQSNVADVTVGYEAFDGDSDAQISLFYDTDAEGYDGILVADGLPETDGVGNFVWNTENVPAGSYHVYATIDDGNNAPVTDYAELSVTVENHAPAAEDSGAEGLANRPLRADMVADDVDGSSSLEYVIDSGPTHGTIEDLGDPLGAYRSYIPSSNWSGTDSFTFRAFDGTNYSEEATVTIEVTAAMAGRHVFYNNSDFDENGAMASEQDDNAVARDKEALLPGETGTVVNYTNYDKGINGIMVDIAGLADADVFYFGNAPGEAGDNPINTIVNATDEIAARNFQHSALNPALIDDPYDYNRDGLVNGTDQIIARENQTNPLTMLRLIEAPAVDVILKGATEQDLQDSEALSADLDWLYEFERMNMGKQTSSKSRSTEAIVDMLLATDWS